MKKRTVNILFIIPSFTSGGAENHSLQTAKAIQQIDESYQIYFLAFGRIDQSYIELLSENEIKVIQYSMNGFMDLSIFKKLAQLIRIFKLLYPYHFKFIFTGTLVPNIIGGILWKFLGAKRFFWHQWGIDSRKNISFFEKIALFFKPTFIANSHACKDNLIFKYRVKDDVFVINNPVNQKIIDHISKPSFNSDAFNIVMVANFFDEKDHESLIRAYSNFITKNPVNSSLTLIGKSNGGGNLNKMKALAFDLGLSNNEIIFEENIDSICEIIHKFHLGVLSSKSEGLSNALIEYLAGGLPVICSKIEANIEVVGEENLKFTFDVGNEKQISDLINKFYTNRELLLQVGEANKKRAIELFSFSKYASKITELCFNKL